MFDDDIVPRIGHPHNRYLEERWICFVEGKCLQEMMFVYGELAAHFVDHLEDPDPTAF